MSEMDQMILNMIAYSIHLAGIVDVTARDVLNYGCWCSLNEHTQRGPVLDVVDQQCKARKQCKKCVQMDHGCASEPAYTIYVDTQL